MIKKFLCTVKGHNIEESSCPYTMRTYQVCIRCGSKGIKTNN
jgi:hypothetical protein